MWGVAVGSYGCGDGVKPALMLQTKFGEDTGRIQDEVLIVSQVLQY